MLNGKLSDQANSLCLIEHSDKSECSIIISDRSESSIKVSDWSVCLIELSDRSNCPHRRFRPFFVNMSPRSIEAESHLHSVPSHYLNQC